MVLSLAVSAKVVASTLGAVAQQLGSPASKEVYKIWNVDEEFETLMATYGKVVATLTKWEADRQYNENSSLEASLQKLEGYCYDTEDIVDYISLHKTPNILKKIIRPKSLNIPHKIVNLRGKMERVRKQIEEILDAGASIDSSAADSTPLFVHSSPLLDLVPLISSPRREQDKQNIIMELLKDTADSSSGVAIIGMDGLGKTALARTVLEDSTIKRRFPLILSAYVCGDFQREIIVQRLEAGFSHQRQVSLQELLRRQTQTALIVLDDLWSVTHNDWYIFKCNYLNSCRFGFKVLITSRNPEVADVTQSVLHHMDVMTDAECKELIMQRANLSCTDRVIWDADIEEIAKMCKGVPALAHNFGLHLTSSAIGFTVQQLKKKDIWKLPQFREVFPSLKLDEPLIRPHLKRCFAYCSLFSQTHTYNREELVQLWEAEGFALPDQKCFEELISRSIFRTLKPASKQQAMYKMHELNHEFAQRLASGKFHRMDRAQTSLPPSCEKSLRHLSVSCDNTPVSLLKKIEKCTKLRTFILLHQYGPKTHTISHPFIYKLNRLRSLDLSHTCIHPLQSVSPLKLLRYLDLSHTDITTLPDSICDLRALRVLKLEESKLVELPKKFNQLTSLTRLHVNMKYMTRHPSRLGMLTNLEFLSSYVVGVDEGHKVAELKNMERLQEIYISGLENIIDKEKAEESLLHKKNQLEKLGLEWDDPNDELVNAIDVLDGLRPHEDLKELTLRNYKSLRFPSWLSSSSRKLVSLSLQDCQDIEVLPSLGKLCHLKTLVFHSIGNVKEIDGQFCGEGGQGFPSLESFEVSEMGKLYTWTGLKRGDMPSLHTLRINGCENLTSLPSLIHQTCLVYLEINNCPVLESLPELPLSMNPVCGKLIIEYCPLIQDPYRVGESDLTDMASFNATQTSLSAVKRFVNEKLFQQQYLIGRMMGIKLMQAVRLVVSFSGRRERMHISVFWVVLAAILSLYIERSLQTTYCSPKHHQRHPRLVAYLLICPKY